MSPEIRMYFPLGPAQVVQLHEQGHVGAGALGFGVDASIRAQAPDGDDDLWEFLALQAAVSHAQNGPHPIIVAAADLPLPAAGATDPGPAVRTGQPLNTPLHLADVVSLHLGDDAMGSAAPAVSDTYPDLSWFDISELSHVVRLLSPPE